MSNRLRAYVRRTLLNSAKEYAHPKSRRTEESTRGALQDALQGTDTGWWTDLIYTASMLEMAHKYRRDIATALDAYRDEVGERFTYRDRDNGVDVGAEQIAGALLRGPYSFEDYRHETDDCGVRADYVLIGLRFAVEWYAGEIARELCPDL